jgi:truncated hemoglobin YjbI
MNKTLYEQIGDKTITQVISAFYQRAFSDPIIGHFFFNLDRPSLVHKQIVFSSCMLGATHLTYTGKSLQEAHKRLPLREAHFRRRQKLMQEVLAETAISEELKIKWLEKEEKLKPLIINSLGACNN